MGFDCEKLSDLEFEILDEGMLLKLGDGQELIIKGVSALEEDNVVFNSRSYFFNEFEGDHLKENPVLMSSLLGSVEEI